MTRSFRIQLIDLDQVSDRVRDGHTGARQPGNIGFATLRGGDVAGDHTVIFAADAASRELNHLVSVVVWNVTLIVVFHVLEVDAAFFLSSAGFLGAAMAIGGQHKVNDYLTGLLVHFEDRYGAGDLIECETVNGTKVRGVVDHIGLFSTRLRDDESAVHLPNHALAHVRNLSQDPSATKIRVRVNERIDEERVVTSLRDLAGGPGLTEVIFLGDIETHQESTGEIEIDISTHRPLNHRERSRLERGVERSLIDSTS
ncbi:MAG: mechanosensitive ion channel domain-containing protein [Ilumatobacter sp.]